MLLAPFTLTNTPVRGNVAHAPRADAIPGWLFAWAVLGALSVLCVPALRGDPVTGLTLPFWLIAAPLLNILWLTRKRWISRRRFSTDTRRLRLR